MSRRGLDVAASAEVPHLGGAYLAGDPFSYSPLVWEYVIERFGIRSIMDLGSGNGYASAWFHRKGMKVVAIDGFEASVLSGLYPTVKHDLTSAPVMTRVDLVHCQEVVEHIEECYLDNLIGSLLCGKFILMTHAVPGQGGYHHVNEQPSEYWISHMERRGCSFLEEDSNRVRALAINDGAIYLRDTGMVFVNSRRI